MHNSIEEKINSRKMYFDVWFSDADKGSPKKITLLADMSAKGEEGKTLVR